MNSALKKKKTEEQNKRGKTRDLFRKIGNIKGTFHPKMGAIKDRKWQRPSRFRRDQEETKRIHGTTVQKKILMNWKTVMVWSATQSQIFWIVKSSGP